MCSPCLYKTGIVLGSGLLSGGIGAGSGAFAAEVLKLKVTIGSIHGLVSGVSFGSITQTANYVFSYGGERRCYQISAWCIGFASGTTLGWGVLKAGGVNLSTPHFLSLAAITSSLGIGILLGAKLGHYAWEHRPCCRRNTNDETRSLRQEQDGSLENGST